MKILNQILENFYQMLIDLFSWVVEKLSWVVEKLDEGCEKVDLFYRDNPIILKLQTSGSFITAGVFIYNSRASATLKGLIGNDCHDMLSVAVGLYGLLLIFLVFLIRERNPQHLRGGDPYGRILLQWVVQAAVKNLSSWVEGAAHLADWPCTIGIFVYACHLVSFFKLFGRFDNYGAIDAAFTVAIALSDQLLKKPFWKIISTLCVVMLMGMRELRAKRRAERNRMNLETPSAETEIDLSSLPPQTPSASTDLPPPPDSSSSPPPDSSSPTPGSLC